LRLPPPGHLSPSPWTCSAVRPPPALQPHHPRVFLLRHFQHPAWARFPYSLSRRGLARGPLHLNIFSMPVPPRSGLRWSALYSPFQDFFPHRLDPLVSLGPFFPPPHYALFSAPFKTHFTPPGLFSVPRFPSFTDDQTPRTPPPRARGHWVQDFGFFEVSYESPCPPPNSFFRLFGPLTLIGMIAGLFIVNRGFPAS